MIKKIYATAEIDGEEPITHERILAADRIAAESLIRRRGWEFAEGPRLYTALVWAVAKRTRPETGDYEEFIPKIVDYLLDADEEQTENPTR